VHIDVCGPMQTKSLGELLNFFFIFIDDDVCGTIQTKLLGGASYIFIFIDVRSNFTRVYFLRKKSDVFEYFKEFSNLVEKQTLKHINILRLDQGGEYTSRVFLKYYKAMKFRNSGSSTYPSAKMVWLRRRI